MTKANVGEIRKALEAVSARLENAERKLATVNGMLRAKRAQAHELSARLAEAPPLSVDAAYARFAETRRSSLHLEIARLAVSLDELVGERDIRRRDVERMLRQKISLEAAIEAAAMERRRSQSQR